MIRVATFLSVLAVPAMAEPPRVVVDIAPVHALVAQVMEGVATPDLLLEQTANPHAVQLRPSQARMLSQAGLVISVGPDLSPWLERALDGLGVDDRIVLMDHPATTLRTMTPAGAEMDHGAPEAEAHDDSHDHGAHDPHVWLSVDNAQAWLPAFADALASRDPDNSAIYRANAAAAAARLDTLTAEIEARLAPHEGAEIVTFHASMGYFADRFGIGIAGSVRPSDAASPSASAISELEALVAAHGVECAFAEPGFDQGLLEAIAGDTGLTIGTLDPTGVLQEPGPGHYAATLGALAESIADCLESR